MIENTKSIDESKRKVFWKKKSILDFENFVFQIVIELKKIPGNFKNQLFTTKGQIKIKSIREDIFCERSYYTNDLRIDDNIDIIFDFSDLLKVKLVSDSTQVLNVNRADVLPIVIDRSTDTTLKSLYEMQVEKSED